MLFFAMFGCRLASRYHLEDQTEDAVDGIGKKMCHHLDVQFTHSANAGLSEPSGYPCSLVHPGPEAIRIHVNVLRTRLTL